MDDRILNRLESLVRDIRRDSPVRPQQPSEWTDQEIAAFIIGLLRDSSITAEIGGRALGLVPFVYTRELGQEAFQTLKARSDLSLAAGNVLGQVADRSIVPDLEALLADRTAGPMPRAAAAYALGTMGNASSMSVLVAVITVPGEDPTVLDYAVEALGGLGTDAQAAVEPIAELLRAESPDVRFSAICALGNIGAKQALPMIEALGVDSAISTHGPVGVEAKRVGSLLRHGCAPDE